MPWQFRVRPVLFVTVSVVVSLLVLVGLLVFVRRMLGPLSGELPPAIMLFVALASAGMAAFARIAWRRNFPLGSPGDLSLTDQVIGWASSLGLVLLAVGCCYPGYRTADWLIWLPILIADQFWRQTFFDAGEPWTGEEVMDAEDPVTPALELVELPQDENLVQQLYRLADDDGKEIIYGTVRADFVTEQRTTVVHIGFCPPLSYLPEIEAEALPGSVAKIKVVQALAHGTRLEVRLPAPAEEDFFLWIDMAARPVGAVASAESA